MKLIRLNCIPAALILFVGCAITVYGQTGSSNITGTVRDTTGSVVPGATVTAKNEATGITSNQTTTDSGVFAFSSLPVGLYTISVEKQGFKTLQKTNNTLEVGTPLTVDLALEVGQVSETVTVQGGTEQLQLRTPRWEMLSNKRQSKGSR